MTYTVKQGDVLEVTRGYPDNHFDGLFCDSPYGIGFMGKEWDHGVPSVKVWAEILRTMKPGAFGLVFGGTRTWHRLACALEDAGFEIRDTLMWAYGSGFPKSYDISKGIDKAVGAEREVVGIKIEPSGRNRLIESKGICNRNTWGGEQSGFRESEEKRLHTAPATPEAQRWQGYGTALKPSWEPMLLIRKPLDGNNVQNALKHGCGGLNIDDSRVKGDMTTARFGGKQKSGSPTFKQIKGEGYRTQEHPQGRWPANLILDEDSAAMLDAQSGELKSGDIKPHKQLRPTWKFSCAEVTGAHRGDSGGASRFFKVVDRFRYCAKASRTERNAGLEGFEEKQQPTLSGGNSVGNTGPHDTRPKRNHHPTVKPLDLCRYLAKLILPPFREGDPRRLYVPFCGSGSEIIGAYQANWDEIIGVEIDPEYCKIAEARLKFWTRQLKLDL